VALLSRRLTVLTFLRRLLLELNVPDEPVWTYFDSQHKFILKQMKESYDNSVSSIKSKSFLCPPLSTCGIDLVLATLERTKGEIADSDDLNMKLASQLQSCLHAVDAKQSDNFIGIL